MTIDAARQLAKKQLSPKRYRHTKNVAGAARVLARRFGADADKAELAGWLHDIVKEKSREDLLQLLAQDAIIAGSTETRPLPVWHGPAAAVYARHQLGVQDEEVLSAIACHTTGRVGMGLLDKVVFLADVISDERSFDGVADIRRLAQTDLDAAVVAAMEENIRYLAGKGKLLDRDTKAAVDALKAQRLGQQQAPAAANGGNIIEPE